MRLYSVIFSAAALATLAWQSIGQDQPTRTPLGSTIQVVLPEGDVEIQYAETADGMVLLAKSLDASVQARRLYLGDGKIAVAFEASSKGFLTPTGLVNAAAIQLKDGSVFKIPHGKTEKWGERVGEVYVLTGGIKYQALQK